MTHSSLPSVKLKRNHSPMSLSGGGMPPCAPHWPALELTWVCRPPPPSWSLQSSRGPVMDGPKSKPRRSSALSVPRYCHSQAQHSRQEWSSSVLTWWRSMPCERHMNWPSMLTGKLERTDAMPPRLLKANLERPSWRRCCICSMW